MTLTSAEQLICNSRESLHRATAKVSAGTEIIRLRSNRPTRRDRASVIHGLNQAKEFFPPGVLRLFQTCNCRINRARRTERKYGCESTHSDQRSNLGICRRVRAHLVWAFVVSARGQSATGGRLSRWSIFGEPPTCGRP